MASILSILSAICPKAKQDILQSFDCASAVFDRFALNTTQRQSHFLAQVLHESACLRVWEENLRYTTTARLMAVWPSRFKTAASAAQYVRNPEALANKVYSGRMGNTVPGDGWKYRGRGLIQLTGRYNYAKYGELCALPLLDHPEMACAIAHALTVAACFWSANGLNELADKNDIVSITKRINGGTNGLQDRKRLYSKVALALGVRP